MSFVFNRRHLRLEPSIVTLTDSPDEIHTIFQKSTMCQHVRCVLTVVGCLAVPQTITRQYWLSSRECSKCARTAASCTIGWIVARAHVECCAIVFCLLISKVNSDHGRVNLLFLTNGTVSVHVFAEIHFLWSQSNRQTAGAKTARHVH
jgi:hypothetical protein